MSDILKKLVKHNPYLVSGANLAERISVDQITGLSVADMRKVLEEQNKVLDHAYDTGEQPDVVVAVKPELEFLRLVTYEKQGAGKHELKSSEGRSPSQALETVFSSAQKGEVALNEPTIRLLEAWVDASVERQQAGTLPGPEPTGFA